MNQDTLPQATVLIADDHKVVAEGVALYLRQHFTVCGLVHELGQLIPTIQRTRPQVLVLDITFAGVNSLPVIRQALERGEVKVRFVVLTAHDSLALEQAAFNAGAHAFLLKGVGTQDLRLAIEAALDNRRYVAGRSGSSPHPSQPEEWSRRKSDIDGVQLRPRQIRALLLIHSGLSRRQAAEEMGLTERGLDYHLDTARNATGIKKFQLLQRWVTDHQDALEAVLLKERPEE